MKDSTLSLTHSIRPTWLWVWPTKVKYHNTNLKIHVNLLLNSAVGLDRSKGRRDHASYSYHVKNNVSRSKNDISEWRQKLLLYPALDPKRQKSPSKVQ